ncbi:MAG: hypothetical protein M0R30_13035 [Methanoregula sp.]|uniref:hypothetical protein n=1 Tax=Methanoregula sp. TaxID=2052170 RepID=UPI0025CC8CE4|nr:hypothetical protein [Methanoregula sp.]MCK9632549.1 hypothetical protein [Methanoregula sp.]
MIKKINIKIAVLLVAFFLIMPVHAAMARPETLPDTPTGIRQDALFLFIGVSKNITSDYTGSEFPEIPVTVTRYGVIEMNESGLQSLNRQILAGAKIPVSVKGATFLFVPDRNRTFTNEITGQTEFQGFLELKSGESNPDYYMHLYFFNNTLSVILSEADRPFTFVKPIINSPPDRQLYYVYSSADETPTGARLDNDVWVMLPSGENKLRNELTPEEIEWYRNEQVKRENIRLNGSVTPSGDVPQQPTSAAPHSPLVLIMALGLCFLLSVMMKKDR